MILSPARGSALAALIGATLPVLAAPAESLTAPPAEASEPALEERSFTIGPAPANPRNWSVQAGVAMISDNDIGGILTGGFERAEGDAGGQLYSLTVNWIAHRFKLRCFGKTFRPQFEPYATLTLVDENGSSLFPDYNAGIAFRWVDFPWDKWIETTFYMGIGLSYSGKVYLIDRERHPDEYRSHLKFDWPIQITFALARWPQHQIVVFNDHQSGGHIFDEGGVNSLGFGYRFEF